MWRSKQELSFPFTNGNPEAWRKGLPWSNSQDFSPALLPPAHVSSLTAAVLEEWLGKLIKCRLSQARFQFFFNINIYLFMAVLGLRCCARAFSSCGEAGAALHCGARAYCSGFSCCGTRALGTRASVVAAHGLSSCGSWALERRLSSCGARA